MIMLMEATVWSVLTGNLGLQALLVGTWLYRKQYRDRQQGQAEEELLAETGFEVGEPEGATAMGQPGVMAEVTPGTDATSHPTTIPTAVPTTVSVAATPVSSQPSPQQQDPRLMGWEFKIVRANRDLFRDPRVFQQLCTEEAEAGWILLEKLDDRRVRFKRPIAMRQVINPEFLSFDPYRTHYGPGTSLLTWVGAIAALLAMILPAYLGYALVSMTVNRPQSAPVPGKIQ